MTRDLLSYLFELVGVALIACGLGMVYEPLAWLWAGGVLMVAAVAVSRPRGGEHGPTDNST